MNILLGLFMQSVLQVMIRWQQLERSTWIIEAFICILKMVYGFIKTKLSRTSCLTFRKHSITVIRSVLISVGTETLSYGLFRVFFACLHLYSDIHLDEAFLQKQYPPRILTAERYCFYVS